METQELESLLSQVLGASGKTVQEVSISKLAANGGNFQSSIFHIRAKIQQNSNGNLTNERPTKEEEELHLIAKVPPAADDFEELFPLKFVFRKEIFFYKEIMSKYQELLDEASLKCDIAARYYGSKNYSTENDTSGELKACIFLENLKASGYSAGNRLEGLELEELKLTMAKLAIFHALGVSVKKTTPAIFEEFSEFCKNVIEGKAEMVERMIQEVLEKFRVDRILQKYMPRILKNIKSFVEAFDNIWFEPWVTIIHMDFGIHNLMFRKREDKVNDIKFVDFQTYSLGNPARDLLRLIFTSVNFEIVPMEAIDQLIDFYHEHFIDALKVLLKCKESHLVEFSRDQLDKQIAANAPVELCPIILTNKVMMLDPEEVNGDKSNRMTFVNTQTNAACINRMRKIIAYYGEKQWI